MCSFGTSNFGRIKQPPELGRKEERGSGELTCSEDLRERRSARLWDNDRPDPLVKADLDCSLPSPRRAESPMFRATYGSSQWNVSNPAQNRPLRAVIINDRSVEIRVICSMTPAAYPPWADNSQVTGRKQETDGTRSSSVPPSAAQATSIPQRLVRKTAGDTHTTGPGSPIAKDVPVLRFDHAAS